MEDILDVLKIIGGVASQIVTISACAALILKPLRERIFGINAYHDGICCLLRNEITQFYYKNSATKIIHGYEFDNIELLYKAYKSFHGNSFIDKIFAEIKDTWTIVE
ncbi:MAG TPA: hypothetical protein PLT28_00405 [Saprospiraceae bacterium]|nr:hypothetical protein [Saprospiraceae bacterium]